MHRRCVKLLVVNFLGNFLVLFLVLFLGVLLPISSVFAFVVISNGGKPAYWPNGVISYEFHSNTSGYFEGGTDTSGTVTDEFQPIRDSFQAWADIAGVQLNFTEEAFRNSNPSSVDRRNTIMWVDTGWTSLNFRPPSNALAVTLSSFDASSGAVVDADIYFNAQSFSWAVVDDASEDNFVDVQNIATHEIGHLIGLDHSSVSLFETEDDLAEATMFYASEAGETSRRTPSSDDVKGVKNLYGTASLEEPVITSVEVLSESFGINELRVTGQNFTSMTSFILTANNFNYYDAVSRYKTIVSSTEAIVEVDAFGLPEDGLSLVAFNRVQDVENFPVEIQGSGLGPTSSNGTSGGGGGGCSLASPSAASSPVSFVAWISLLLILSFGFRRRSLDQL